MKKVLSAIAVIVLMASCSKKNDVIDPLQEQATSSSFFRDANLAVASMTAANASGKVQINFTTVYEKNISKIEVMAGDSPNYLCSIYENVSNGNSTQSKSYFVTDNAPKAQTMYYMIRYTLANGDWGYTNVIKFQLGK